MKSEIDDITFMVIQAENKKLFCENIIKELNIKIKKSSLKLKNLKKSLAIIKEVGLKTQQQVQYQISNLVTFAIKSINESWPEFKLEMIERRNQTECDLLFIDDKNKYKPIYSSGGGLLDIASFGLRIAIWSLRKNRKLFILDEPFKFLSADLHQKASEMLKELSKKLDLQFIIVSHQEDINFNADKIFKVSKNRNKSIIEVLK